MIQSKYYRCYHNNNWAHQGSCVLLPSPCCWWIKLIDFWWGWTTTFECIDSTVVQFISFDAADWGLCVIACCKNDSTAWAVVHSMCLMLLTAVLMLMNAVSFILYLTKIWWPMVFHPCDPFGMGMSDRSITGQGQPLSHGTCSEKTAATLFLFELNYHLDTFNLKRDFCVMFLA